MKRKDSQLSGMAGEFLVVGKLFKKGLQAAVTFGNAKAIDILAYNPENKKNYNIQVKTLRKKNCFLIDQKKVNPSHIYVFVLLNDFDKDENFYILKGSEIIKNADTLFGSSNNTNFTAINYGPLKEYQDNWALFEK